MNKSILWFFFACLSLISPFALKAQTILLEGIVTFVNSTNSSVNVGDPVKVGLDMSGPHDIVPGYPFGGAFSVPYSFELGQRDFGALRGSLYTYAGWNGEYGIDAVYGGFGGSNFTIDVTLLSSKPIMPDIYTFPSDVPMSDFYEHLGLFTDGGGQIKFDITSYSVIPEAQTASLVLATLSLAGVLFRHRFSSRPLVLRFRRVT